MPTIRGVNMSNFPFLRSRVGFVHSFFWCVLTWLVLGSPERALAIDKNPEKQLQTTVDKIIHGNAIGMDSTDFLVDLENHIARNPGEESWLKAAGILNFQAGKFDQARRFLLKLPQPSNADNRLIAISLFEIKEYRKALSYFHRIADVRKIRSDWNKFCQALSLGGSRSEALKEWEAYRGRYVGTDAVNPFDGLEFLAECYRRPLQKEKLLSVLEPLLKKSKGTIEEGKYLLEISTLLGETNLRATELRSEYLKLNPQDFAAALGLANMYESRGEIKKAMSIFLAVAPKYSQDAKFNRHLAGLLAKTDMEKAILYYEVCRTLAPKDFEIPLEIARLQEVLKHPELAIEAYQAALEINPTHAIAKARMLALVSDSKSPGPWLETMVKNEKKNSQDHAFQFQLAKIFLAAKDSVNSYKYLQKSLKNSHDNEDYAQLLPSLITTDAQILKNFSLLQKLASTPKSTPELLVLVGRGFSLYHNQSRAAEMYAKVMELNPKLLEHHRQPILDVFGVKNYSVAGNLAELFLKTDSEDVDIRRIHVTSLYETKAKPARIRSAIQALVTLEPYDDKWYLRLAEYDLAAKDTAGAIKHGHAWVKMHPDDKAGLLFLEPLAAKSRDGDMYLNLMDNMERLEPKNQSQYELKAAYFQFASGKFAQAVEALGKLTAVFPNDAQLWNRLGLGQIKLGRENAGTALEKAYRLEPGNLNFAHDYAFVLNSESELKANLDVFQALRRATPNIKEKQKLAHSLYLNGSYTTSALEWDGLIAQDPETALSDSTAAMAYLRSGQLAKGKSILEKRLAANPHDVSLLATLADVYAKEGDSNRQMNAIERIVHEDRGMGDYVLRLAREKTKAGQMAEALSLYSQWSRNHPVDVAALISFRDIAEKQKDTASLLESLRYLTQIKNADIAYRYQLAEVDFARSSDTKALQELVKVHPDYRQGKLLLAFEYHSKQAYELLAPMTPFLISESETNSDLLEVLADLYAHQKKVSEADRVYLSWYSVRRNNRDVFNKVYTYSKENHGTNLIPILKFGCESFPQDLVLLENLGNALGYNPSALEAFLKLLGKQPDNENAVEKTAEIAKTLRDRKTEAKWAKRWSELKPNEEKPWQYLIESLNPISDKAQIADAMEGLVHLQSGNSDLILKLAQLQEDLGHFSKAIDHYRNALYLNPKDKSIRDRLVTLMKGKGNKLDLADVLTEIQNIDSSAHEAQFELAKLYIQKQDKDKAYAYLSTALNQSPLNQNYQKLLPKTIHTNEQIVKHFKLLQEIAGRPETARSDAGNIDLFMLLGQGYALQEKWKESAENYALVHRIDAKKLLGIRDVILACYHGQNFGLAGELTEKYFEKKLDFDKEIRQIQILCYEKTMRDPALIRKCLQLLLAVDKDNAGGQLRLAELDLKTKDTVAAIQNIRNCLTTSPNEARAYRMLLPLISTLRADQRVTYVVVLEKLARLDTVQRANYQNQLAEFYFNRKNLRQAARLWTEVVVSRPGAADIWYRLGQCRNQLQAEDQGIACFQKAYQLQPNNLSFAHTYAQALVTPEDYKTNLKLYQFIEDHGPSRIEYFGLAMAYFYNENYRGAAKAWDMYNSETSSPEKFIPEAALAYVRTSQPSKALPFYLLRESKESNNLGLLDTLCHLYTKTGNIRAKNVLLGTIVRLDPTFQDYQLQLAHVQQETQDTASAIDNFGQWTARHPADINALKALHRLAQDKGDTAALENALTFLVQLKDPELEYSLQLAELKFKFTGDTRELEKMVKLHSNYQRGRVILAKEFFRRYDIPNMIPFEKALAEECRKDPDLLGMLAELYAYQNKKDQANQAFRDNLVYRMKATTTGSHDDQSNQRQAFDKAWLYADANKSPYLTEVLKIGNKGFPGETPIQIALATALGKDPEALALYKQILDKDPNNFAALRSGAELAVSLGRPTEAIAWLEKWSTLEPGSPHAWKLLVDSYERVKDMPKAADAKEHLMMLSPTDASLAFDAAKAFLQIKNYEKALELFIRASELKPKDQAYAFEVKDLLNVMAEAYLHQREISHAIDIFGLLLQKDPKHQKANLYVGMWLAENRDYATAENLLKLGIDQSTESNTLLAKAWRLFGDCQSARGESRASLEDYKRALKLNPLDIMAATSRLEMTRTLNLVVELPYALSDVVNLDSANTDACLALAENRLKVSDFNAASALYRQVLKVQKADPETWGHYGEALEGAKRNKEALSAWDSAYALGDRNPYILHGLARLHKAAGELVMAKNALEDLVVLQPENDEASAWLAELDMNMNQLDKAEEMYVQAAQADPNKIEYTQGLAEVYLRRGDAESVLEILEPVRGRLTTDGRLVYADGLRLAGKSENAVAVYLDAYQKQPSVRALCGLANAHLDRNKPLEAKQLIEASQFQSDPEIRLRLGQIFLAMHENDKAGRILQSLVKANPANPFFLLTLAQIHAEQKNNPLALKEFLSVLQLRADLAPAAFGAGMLLISNGLLKEARTYFFALGQSLTKPDRALGLQGLAAASEAEKKPGEAADYLEQAAEVYPTASALAKLSMLCLKLGRIKPAEEWAQKSLETNEDFTDGIIALAEAMLAQSQNEGARDYLKEAIVRNPKSCELQLEFSKVLVAMENFQDIASNNNPVLSLCPDEALSYYYAGVGADRAYQKKKAEEYFRSYKKLGGDLSSLPKGY